MSTRERRKLTEFSLVKQGRSSVAEAARRLEMSQRQARRNYKRYMEQGDAGLIHGLRGRPSNSANGELRRRVIEVYRQKYLEFNAAHAAEMLEDNEKGLPPSWWSLVTRCGVGSRQRGLSRVSVAFVLIVVGVNAGRVSAR